MEADYYGASTNIAHQLGLPHAPFSDSGWRHGWMYYRAKFISQLTVWGQQESQYLLAQQEHVDFLKSFNIDSTAVGMPFIYADAIDESLRVPNTLLVMPPHTLPYVPAVGNEESYILEIENIRDEFDAVVFCVHHSCYERGVWPELIKKYNYPMIIGASAHQSNALVRLQKLFSSFEYVTSNIVGSHIPYAAYCGAKVSFYGTFCDLTQFNYENDPQAQANPELWDYIVERSTEKPVREAMPFIFCQHPKEASFHTEWAQKELGQSHKKPSHEIAELLGWNNAAFQLNSAKRYNDIVKCKSKERLLDSLVEVFNTVGGRSFALYGGGKVGSLILNLLVANGHRPHCIFDQNFESLKELNGIKVCDPQDISTTGASLILIASFTHQREIRENIYTMRPDIEIWSSD
ncbi:hypothetical protein C7Y69_05035 [Alteromonas sp. KS69]|nr:hypothetical protein C7Y69_05035 [Alteromonas sp. KS69]